MGKILKSKAPYDLDSLALTDHDASSTSDGKLDFRGVKVKAPSGKACMNSGNHGKLFRAPDSEAFRF